MARPFLRWAGSKRRLADQIISNFPSEFGTYYEPFLGGGSVFFGLEPETAVLGDKLEPLVECYSVVRDRPGEVLEWLRRWPVDKDTYYEVRRLRPRSEVARAAKFIYLNKTAWNGLYRVNGRGEFNVPFGRPKSNWITSAEVLGQSSTALQSATIRFADFEDLVAPAGAGDLVYFDPPYVTGHNDNGFLEYNKTLFSWDDQVRLRDIAMVLRERGATVVVSNANHASIEALYADFRQVVVHRHSTLAGKASLRRPTSELLLIGSPACPGA